MNSYGLSRKEERLYTNMYFFVRYPDEINAVLNSVY